MTTRDHLIYHLQELYSFERDYLPLLMEAAHTAGNERLKELLLVEHEGLRNEMETLERALNLLSARYKQEHTPLVPGFKEATERFKHQLNPSQEQLDIHAATETLKVAQMLIGAYWVDVELARAIGESDVALLLEETLQRETQSRDALHQYLPRVHPGDHPRRVTPGGVATRRTYPPAPFPAREGAAQG